MISLQDFEKKEKLEHDEVMHMLRHYSYILEGHIEGKGKKRMLDDIAAKLLKDEVLRQRAIYAGHERQWSLSSENLDLRVKYSALELKYSQLLKDHCNLTLGKGQLPHG